MLLTVHRSFSFLFFLSAAVAGQLVCLPQPCWVQVQSELVTRKVSEDSTPEQNRTLPPMIEFQSEHACRSTCPGWRPARRAAPSRVPSRPAVPPRAPNLTWLPPHARRGQASSSAAPDHVTRSRQHHPASRPARRRHGTELPSSARLVRGYACGLTATGAGAPPRSVRSVSVSRSTNVRCRRDGRTARERERPNPLAPRRYK